MELKELKVRENIEQNKRLTKAYSIFGNLLTELKKKELPAEIVDFINNGIEEINSFLASEKELKKLIRKTQSKIVRLIEKELKMVPKNYYRNTWLAVGMSAFGIPLGVVFGTVIDNMGYIGIGMPIGMAIGIVIGGGMDKKALEEGRQLDVELT